MGLPGRVALAAACEVGERALRGRLRLLDWVDCHLIGVVHHVDKENCQVFHCLRKQLCPLGLLDR